MGSVEVTGGDRERLAILTLALLLTAVMVVAGSATMTTSDFATAATTGSEGPPESPVANELPPSPPLPESPPPESPFAGARPQVRVDKNCYFPREPVIIILTNVGNIPLVLSWSFEWEVESATGGLVHVFTKFTRERFILDPGEFVNFTWDQTYNTPDGRFGLYVPPGNYTARVWTQVGIAPPEPVILGEATFEIGQCGTQFDAGRDIAVNEGETFRLEPTIQFFGDATITSITWDVDLTFDANGDGNATNDADLVGKNPEHAFGDDGEYDVIMNVRGFGNLTSKERLDQDVVFAIDSSGSMTSNDPSGLRKTATKSYVDRMILYDQGAVVDFDDDAILVNGHHLSTNYAQVKADIDTIDAAGGTFMAPGLRASAVELRDHGDPAHQWLIIYLTDADSQSIQDQFQLPEAIQLAKDLGIRVFTIGLNIPEDLGRVRMEQIANETGGKFFPAPTAEALEEILSEIAKQINETRGGYFSVSDTVTVSVLNVNATVTGFVAPLGCADEDDDEEDDDDEDDGDDDDDGDDGDDDGEGEDGDRNPARDILGRSGGARVMDDDDGDDDDGDDDDDDEDRDCGDEDEEDDGEDRHGASPNLISDPGFESGSLVLVPRFGAAPPSFGFWTARDNPPQPPRLVNSPQPVHSGAWAAEVDTRAATYGEHLIQDFTTSSASYVWTFWIYPIEGFNVVEVVYNWDRGVTGSAVVATALEYGPAGTVFHAWDTQANFAPLSPDSWHEVTIVADACSLVQDYLVDGAPVGSIRAKGGIPSAGNATVILGDVSNIARHGLFYYDDQSFSEFVCEPDDDDDGGDDDDDDEDGHDDDDDEDDEDEEDGGSGAGFLFLFYGNATDPGSDDLTFTWDWGDGTIDVFTFFHNGVGPDLFPSPNGGPAAVNSTATHGYTRAGTYTVILTVTDDDGGMEVLSFTVTRL